MTNTVIINLPPEEIPECTEEFIRWSKGEVPFLAYMDIEGRVFFIDHGYMNEDRKSSYMRISPENIRNELRRLGLPDNYQANIVACHSEGLDYEELAKYNLVVPDVLRTKYEIIACWFEDGTFRLFISNTAEDVLNNFIAIKPTHEEAIRARFNELGGNIGLI